jgi:hypothetical protein
MPTRGPLAEGSILEMTVPPQRVHNQESGAPPWFLLSPLE